MTQYDDTNRGFAMINTRKKTDKHPDWTGKLNVDGVDRRISVWKGKTKKGEPIMKFSLQAIDEQARSSERGQPPKRERYADDGVDLDDEIPW